MDICRIWFEGIYTISPSVCQFISYDWRWVMSMCRGSRSGVKVMADCKGQRSGQWKALVYLWFTVAWIIVQIHHRLSGVVTWAPVTLVRSCCRGNEDAQVTRWRSEHTLNQAYLAAVYFQILHDHSFLDFKGCDWKIEYHVRRNTRKRWLGAAFLAHCPFFTSLNKCVPISKAYDGINLALTSPYNPVKLKPEEIFKESKIKSFCDKVRSVLIEILLLLERKVQVGTLEDVVKSG